jgi:ADP-ribose pyrophosphatase
MEKTLKSQVVYDGRVVRLRVDTVATAKGRETTREIVEHSDVIVVVPIDAEDNVLMVRQYRKPVEKELLELPAGGIDNGEDPEDAVRRELREEIGYLPQKLERLGGFYSAPGYCSEYLHLYLATDLVPSRLLAEDLVRVSAEQIEDLIASGQLCDAKTIAGLLTYREHQKRGNG